MRFNTANTTCSSPIVTVRALTFGVWSALGLIMWPAVGQAQIVADQNAPANQRPTILNTANSVPQVNIQTPSAAGVSRNTYSQFDVQQQGAILNNSHTDAQTQLGGWVQGNPWLANGTARVILNEVNSSNPSLLRGYVEVAGSRAQVVIANPSGVTCDGCGFINANRATLTTGTPIFNGGNLDGYRVQGGAITIAGAGLDASRADYTDLIARSVQINAGIWANQLKVTAGANQVDADHTTATPIAGTGAAPAFAIDVAQLGGMYAGKITLVGTEAGVGVRNAGNIGASAGEVIVTAEGRLENAGRITSTSHTQIDSNAGIQNSGTIYAQANASLGTRGNIDNSGVIAAQGNTTLAATGANSQIASTSGSVLGAGVQTDGSLGASGALNISATQSIAAQGQNLSGGDQTFAAQTLDLSGSQTSASGIRLSASQGDVNLTGATVAIGQTLTANAGRTLRTDNAKISATQINASANDLTNVQGEIIQTGSGDMALNLPGSIDNTQGKIAASGNATVAANSLNNTQGQITAGQALSVGAAQTLTNAQGLLAANLQVSASGSRIDNAQGTIGSVRGTASVTATSAGLDNTAGRIEAAQAINISSVGLTNTDGVITGSSLALDSRAQALDNTRGKLATTGANDSGALDIQSGALNSGAGLIQSHGALAIDTHGQTLANTNSGASGGITSQSTLTLTTGDLDNTAGYIGGTGALAANSAAIGNTQGGIIASAAQLNLGGSALDNRGGQIQASGDVGITLSGALNNTASLVRSGSTLTVSANSIANTDTQSANRGLEGQSVNLTARQINNGSGAIRADNALTLTSGGTIDNTQGLISSGKTATLQDPDPANKTLAIANTGGTLIAGQQLNVDSASLSGDGKVLSRGDLSIKLTQDYLHTGELQADGSASLETAGTLTNQSTLLAGAALNLKAATLDNRATGTISATRVKLEATGSHTNRGLIDGQDTIIETVTLNNLGTGRIYGDHVAIGTTTVTNDAESGAAPVLAARTRLDIGAATITNREHALIFSAGDLAIGGSLDANKQATGQAATLNNNSATIEALGSMTIAAANVNNTNEHFASENRISSVQDNLRINDAPNYYVMATRTTTDPAITTTDPGRLLAGGNLTLNSQSILNQNSQIIAGSALQIVGAAISNLSTEGQHRVNDTGTSYTYTVVGQNCGWYRWSYRCNDTYGWRPAAYESDTYSTVTVSTGISLANTAPTGTGTRIAALSTGSVNQTPGGANAASVNINNGPIISPITQVAALNGNSANGPAAAIRSGGANTRAPDNSLFRLNPVPGASYLIETDPQFASYRNWLSSDYLLNALSIDPATTQKRLGDGFYEQKLVREQVSQLTGRRFLDGYASDEAQYQALMGNAVTYAQAHQLRPGIALSAQQMAQLTSDLVWLVEKTITLPNGQTTLALVPQLYVRVRDGDLQATGALIAGNSVSLDFSGKLTNSGTIAGRNAVALSAENIDNLGGRIGGSDVAVQARADLNNIGGTIEAANSLAASAGRDLNVTSTTRSSSNQIGANTSNRTNIDRVAGLSVTGGGGTLVAVAGRDMNLDAAQIANEGQGGTTIAAGNNLNLGTVTTSASNRIVWDSNNTRSDSSRSDIGTRIQTRGDLRLSAGNDLNAKAANATSAQGALVATAGNNLNLTAGEANRSTDEAHQYKGRSGLFSSKTTTTRDTLNETTAPGTTLSGNTATVLASRDINLKGSNLVSTLGTTLAAGNNINVEAASNTMVESHFRDEKKSGLFSNGGLSITLGSQQQSVEAKNTGMTAVSSTVGSIQGDVALDAGQTYKQTGSEVIAPVGDIDIGAKKIEILEARESSRSSTETKFKQSGLTVAITSPVISAIQTAGQMREAAGQTRDGRMQALAGATAALAAKNAYDAVQTNPGQAGGINFSISIGASQSQSNSVQTASAAAGSTVAAGGNVNLGATGAGKDSGLTVRGSAIKAGNNVALNADGGINLLAAGNTAEQRSTNSSSSAGIGVSFGTDGLMVTASASKGRGNADGNDVNWTNTRVEAGNQLTLQSGGDTTMKGATASGKQVIANIGANLNVESLQDTSRYDSKQQSLGGSISVGYGKMGGSFNASKSKINSDFASVGEQSGIKAGDGGFKVEVKGNTDLKGAVITSTDKAVRDGKNSLSTGTLTVSDMQNSASYSANSAGVNIGTSVSLDGKLVPAGTSAGLGKDGGSASSTTKAGISGIAGNKDARTGDAETGIAKIFDADKVQKDINAQVQITQAFGREAPKAVANFAQTQAAILKTQAAQAVQAGDTARAGELLAEAGKWDEGGMYRVALHTATGALAGGAQGALGAGAVAGAAPLLDQFQQNVQTALKDAGANETLAKLAGQLVAQGTAAGLGSAVSGGSTAGAAMGFNVDANNRQLHPSEEKWLKDKAKDFAKKEGVSEKEALERLTQQALKDVDYLWRAQLADGDDTAAKAFLGSARQTFTNDLGEQQKLFTATGQQLFRPEMFADTADPAFSKQFAQSGISRNLSTGLAKELKDSGIALKDGTIDLLKTAKDNPGLVLDALWSAIKGLPVAVADSFRETGAAIGEGGAVALNEDINAKLNAIYGTDVSGYQQAMLAIRTLSAIGGAAGVAKAGGGLSEATAKAVGKKLDEELTKGGGRLTGPLSAEAANAPHLAKGNQPPYAVGSAARDIVLENGLVFVRVHGDTNQVRSWMMRPQEIEGLSAQQIKDKFSLPEIPSYVSDVYVPAGTSIRVGTVAPQPGWGSGGATQYELLQRLPSNAFRNQRPLP